jgi:hypothetical protein
MSRLLGLGPATNGIEGAVGKRDDVERIQHLGSSRQDHRVHRGVDGGRVERAEFDPFSPRTNSIAALRLRVLEALPMPRRAFIQLHAFS